MRGSGGAGGTAGQIDEVLNILSDSLMRNTLPFPVWEFVAQDDRYLDAQRLAAVIEGPNAEARYWDRTQRRRKRHRRVVREDRWAHASVRLLEYPFTVRCNMEYARTRGEITWVEGFHPYLDEFLTAQKI